MAAVCRPGDLMPRFRDGLTVFDARSVAGNDGKARAEQGIDADPRQATARECRNNEALRGIYKSRFAHIADGDDQPACVQF